MSSEIYADNQQKYTIEILTGDVKGAETWSETIVRGAGSTVVYQGSGGGSMQISSQVNTRHRFYVVTDSKYEIELDTTGLNFNVRDGHRISAVWGGKSNDKQRKLIFLYNYNTRNKTEVKQDLYRSYLERETIKPNSSALIGLFFCELLIIPGSFLVVSLLLSPLIWLFTNVLAIPFISYAVIVVLGNAIGIIWIGLIYIISKIAWSRLISYARNWIDEHNRLHEWLDNLLNDYINRETQRLESGNSNP